ncbi:MAG: MotA/TolQ/ExbB proton channel family protein [Candidatus Omnitrophota bacterium]
MVWIIIKGGPLMIPILAGSVIGFAIVVEKIWSLWTIKLDVPKFAEVIFSRLRSGQTDLALKFCAENLKHPISKIFKIGIERRDLPVAEIEKTLERLGMFQVNDLEKYLGGLISIIGIEPLLGFLGTITGLIKAFMAWEQAGSDITVSALAQGIYQAMITTAAGLSVAVPLYLLCNYIISRIKHTAKELSNYSMELVEVIAEMKRGKTKA